MLHAGQSKSDAAARSKRIICDIAATFIDVVPPAHVTWRRQRVIVASIVSPEMGEERP
jgi:hypothetical protein